MWWNAFAPQKFSVWVPSHLTIPGDGQQKTARKTDPNCQIWEETWKGSLYPKYAFWLKRKYFCHHYFPDRGFILRGSFLLTVRPKIRWDASTRPNFHCQKTDNVTNIKKMVIKIRERELSTKLCSHSFSKDSFYLALPLHLSSYFPLQT